MSKKDFHALINTQMMRFVEGQNKDTISKKANNTSDTSATSIESSDLEE